ncbi:MAG: Rieske 2Fe-2S domain-containing protein [Gemmatimonadetes bacterium]|nr:Rieske 2Fe-2S domain-containing protein [Gemmatimonadota bacterium]
MKSRANFLGHPLHPILIPFPLAFLTGALAFDAAGWCWTRPDWWSVGYYLAIAGVVMGLVAAVPGLIDYFAVVPPNSSAKQRATKHMLVNLAALALFAFSWLLRGDPSAAPDGLTLGVQVLGLVLLTSGGWMGGTLVYRNVIGVDHRYAHAGKWREERVEDTPGAPVTVGKADELKVNQMKLLHVGSRRIVLGRTEQGYVAFDDRCTHKGGPLSDGVMICGTVQCPWHGSQFDTATGAVKAGPAGDSIATYRVEQHGDELRLRL